MSAVINQHIINHTKYYQALCKNLYRGRYLYEDLFQEFYLKFLELPAERINKLKETDKLIGTGTIIIKYLFHRRKRNKKNGLPVTTLFETVGHKELFDSGELFDIENYSAENKYSDELADKLKDVVGKCLADKKHEQDILYFLQGQEQTLTSIADGANIHRVYVSAGYNRAERLLRKELTK